jgi:hypothetical protein
MKILLYLALIEYSEEYSDKEILPGKTQIIWKNMIWRAW